MEPIDWQQKGNKVYLIINQNNEPQKILLNEKILPFIIAHTPKVFFVKININGNIKEFIVDFSTIKPVINRTNSLKISTKKTATTVHSHQPTDNYYVIMRGESFQNRFLSIKGWTAQEFAFPIVFFTETEKQKQETKVKTKFEKYENKSENAQTETVKKTIKSTSAGNLRECPKCKAIIIDNVDYCPKCFTPLFEPEQGVDFAL
jgi:hypothetical protein